MPEAAGRLALGPEVAEAQSNPEVKCLRGSCLVSTAALPVCFIYVVCHLSLSCWF